MTPDETVAIARFGIEAETFAASPLGRYLADKCEEAAKSALEQLAVVEPGNTGEIRRLQNEIATARNTMAWILGAIQRGRAALHALEAREATD